MKKATIILGVAVCSVIALSGCSAATGGGGSGNSLKFAVVGPFSGDNAAFGEAQVNGIQIAVDQINKGGGINGKSVAIEKFDDKCDPTEAASVASRIASDGNFEAVLGHLCSSSTLAALPVYQRAGLSVFSASSSNPKISKGGYGNFTRNISTDDVQGGQLIDFAKKLDKKRIGIVYASDDYGQGLYDSAVKKAKESGAEIVAAETFTPTSTKDYTPTLTKVGAAKPDLLLLLGYYNDMGTLVSQIDRTSLSGIQMAAAAGSAQPDFVSLGGAATEGTYFLSYYDPASPLPANQEYVKTYSSTYPGKRPTEQAAYWYEVPFIIKAAIEKEGGTKDTLTPAIHKVEFDGPTGHSKFADNGDVVGKTGVVSRVTKGQIVIDSKLTADFATR